MIDAFAARTIAALRDTSDVASVQNNTHIVPEVYFSWDAERAQVSVTPAPGGGKLLEAQIEVSGTPRWLGLNIGLGIDTLHRGDQLVVVMDIAADHADTFQLALISASDGKRIDTLLEEPISAKPSGVVRTVVHNLVEDDAHSGNEAYHTLAIRLPGHSHHLSLRDLRIVVVPSGKGARAAPRSVSDFA